jgi:hypothetical protein
MPVMADPDPSAGDDSTDQFKEMAWIKFLVIEPLDAKMGWIRRPWMGSAQGEVPF